MPQEKVTVRIAGREYTLSDGGDPDRVRRVAALTDRAISEAAAGGAVGRELAATSAAMRLCDELVKAQDDNTRLRRELAALSQINHENA